MYIYIYTQHSYYIPFLLQLTEHLEVAGMHKPFGFCQNKYADTRMLKISWLILIFPIETAVLQVFPILRNSSDVVPSRLWWLNMDIWGVQPGNWSPVEASGKELTPLALFWFSV